MKSKKSLKQFISVGALAGIAFSFTYLPTGRAELVYEPEISPAAPAAVRADDRDQMRTALQSSEKAQATVQSNGQATQSVQQVQTVQAARPQVQYVAPVAQPQQPVAVYSVTTPTQVAEVQAPVQVIAPAAQSGVSTTDAPQTEVQSLSKTELMRRERTRTELKNEDLLQERLEELRLRDEKRRTDQLLGAEGSAAGQQGGTAVMTPVGENMPTQGVAAPITEHPGEVVTAPVPTAAQAQAPGPNVAAYSASPYTPQAQAQIVGAQSVTSAQALPADNSDHVKLSISPHAGVSVMNADSAFNVTGKYAAGIGLGMGVTDNLTFEVGYTYAEYGVGLGGVNAFYNQQFNGTSDSYVLKQNVFDAGLKLSLLGADSRFRPYVGAGGAYSKGYLNYPSSVSQFYQQYNPNFSPDFESSDFLGYLSVGFDAQVSKTISVGLNARFYKVLSDSENENLYYGSFYGGGYYGGGGDATKYQAGTQLAQSSFYSLLGNVSFSF